VFKPGGGEALCVLSNYILQSENVTVFGKDTLAKVLIMSLYSWLTTEM